MVLRLPVWSVMAAFSLVSEVAKSTGRFGYRTAVQKRANCLCIATFARVTDLYGGVIDFPRFEVRGYNQNITLLVAQLTNFGSDRTRCNCKDTRDVVQQILLSLTRKRFHVGDQVFTAVSSTVSVAMCSIFDSLHAMTIQHPFGICQVHL